ncbi:MAG: YeeE/YedE family protein [Neomegalonema sp.]|nr:YeeE/YedE family protein [Neomegalonema sp.]
MIATEFTPLTSLVGGALIGLATVGAMLALGRIMGATGILSGAVLPTSWRDWSWRAAMLLGMAVGPAAYLAVTGQWPAISIPISREMIVVGGFVVGVGVTLGGGCTSGHGVCGLARIARRSLIAVPVFMLGAAASVFVIRHVVGG